MYVSLVVKSRSLGNQERFDVWYCVVFQTPETPQTQTMAIFTERIENNELINFTA
jgi:hypothetical protein